MEGMPGEQGGDQGAAPEGAGHAPEHQEKQQRVGRVQEQAGHMVPPGVELEQLAIQHVAEQGQRMPVAGHLRAPGVVQSGLGHSRLHDGIGRDKVRVVVTDKIIAGDGLIDRQGERGQHKANPQGLMPGRRSWRWCGWGHDR